MVALQVVHRCMFLSILTIAPMRIIWSGRWKGLLLLPIFPRSFAPRRNAVRDVPYRIGNEN
jgi:hypothetical protein